MKNPIDGCQQDLELLNLEGLFGVQAADIGDHIGEIGIG